MPPVMALESGVAPPADSGNLNAGTVASGGGGAAAGLCHVFPVSAVKDREVSEAQATERLVVVAQQDRTTQALFMEAINGLPNTACAV